MPLASASSRNQAEGIGCGSGTRTTSALAKWRASSSLALWRRRRRPRNSAPSGSPDQVRRRRSAWCRADRGRGRRGGSFPPPRGRHRENIGPSRPRSVRFRGLKFSVSTPRPHSISLFEAMSFQFRLQRRRGDHGAAAGNCGSRAASDSSSSRARARGHGDIRGSACG